MLQLNNISATIHLALLYGNHESSMQKELFMFIRSSPPDKNSITERHQKRKAAQQKDSFSRVRTMKAKIRFSIAAEER